jgi:hypothetical protein
MLELRSTYLIGDFGLPQSTLFEHLHKMFRASVLNKRIELSCADCHKYVREVALHLL